MKIIDSFKKIFKQFHKFIFTTKGLIISSLALLLAILIFLIITIYGPWWRIWPQKIRANIALNRLALSVYKEPYCRSDCYFERLVYQSEILSFSDNRKYFSKISNIIFQDDESIAWRLELLKTISHKNDWPEDFFERMQDYLDNNSSNLEFKQYLLLYFINYLDLDDYINILNKIISDTSIYHHDRALALGSLVALNSFNFESHLNSFLEEGSDDFIIEVLKILGGDLSRFTIEEKALFDFLDNIMRSTNSSFTSRRLALFILSDFINQEIEGEATALLERIVLAGELDKFSRYLAIDILNNYLSDKRELPDISQDDWSWYYGQK